MNANFHKAQAEGLIKEANRIRQRGLSDLNMSKIETLMQIAQVHATLANIPDGEGNEDW